jgi:BirA family biotin operon repressor/biotin-[acetyl-CoA-carboxylase] ligase
MTQRERILRLLSDGRFRSGAALGETLGIGRSAVWRHVRAIKDLGVDVFAVPGKGYRLAAPIELLDREEIVRRLDPGNAGRLRGLEIRFEIDSTNRYLLDHAARGGERPWLCFAETQSAGRGRRGRRWLSPFGANLYFSLLWRFELGADVLTGLSLVAGAAIAEALHRMGIEGIGLKWPNDLFHENRKLGGLLIEVSGEASGPWDAVVGVGINLDMPRIAGRGIDQPWTDLNTAAGRSLGRNRAAAAVVDALLDALPRFERRGFAPFRALWTRYDIALDRMVSLHTGNGRMETGRARGVGEQGALLLECDGIVRSVTSGDISLRFAGSDPAR